MSFAKTLNNITQRHHTSKVFDDFLQMAVCCYSLGKSEDLYLERAKSYDTDELKGFGHALGALIMEHEKTNGLEWNDFLGSYFEEFGQYNSKMGQFFTPVSLCKMMAQIVKPEVKEYRATVNDPSCGSSRNLIAHAQMHPNNRFNFFYLGQDLDQRCCLMSVLNFVMFGMSGVVIHMNCISLEIYRGWRIYLPETGLGVHPLTVDQCKYHLFNYETEKQPKEEIIERQIKTEQMKLF